MSFTIILMTVWLAGLVEFAGLCIAAPLASDG
jgi:hypothetical protein